MCSLSETLTLLFSRKFPKVKVCVQEVTRIKLRNVVCGSMKGPPPFMETTTWPNAFKVITR